MKKKDNTLPFYLFRPLTYLIVFTIVTKNKSQAYNSSTGMFTYLSEKNRFAAFRIIMKYIALCIHDVTDFLLANGEWRYKRAKN